MLVSVIISLYNEENYLKKCIESLQQQTLKDIEIIIIDDGSEDNSKLKIKNLKLQLKVKNLILLEQQHLGPATARNFGVKQAKGEILVFVDGDMYFDKKFIKELVYPIQSGTVRGTYSTEEYVANWDNVWARCWNYNWNLPPKKRIDPARTDQQKDFRSILKTEFVKVGGFDNTGYTDTWTLAEKLGYKPTPTKALYYHYNPSNLKEVFKQASWVAKRKYKLGFLGRFITLFRVNFIFSLLNGCKKSIIHQEPAFIIFKLVYDLGYTLGLLTKALY